MKQITILLFLILPMVVHAQDTETMQNRFHIGIGAGLDYGGLGIRGTYLPNQSIGLFIGAGYNLDAIGYNAGAHYILPAGRHQVYFTGMYGYNGVIVLKGDVEEAATYYGFSAGVGFQLNSSRRNGFWNFEFLLPFRNSNFKEDLDTLKDLGVKVSEPLPFTLSIGYHFRIN